MRLLDAICRRYGQAPHKVLTWSPYQLGLARLCLQRAAIDAEDNARRWQRNSEGSMVPLPLPVMVLPDPYGRG